MAPIVSFSTNTTLLAESVGSVLTFNFAVTGDIPPEGITVNLEGDAARIMQQFTAAQTRFNDAGETFNRFDKGLVNNNVTGGTLELFSLEDGDPSETASNPDAAGDAYLTNFTFTITEPTASIDIPIFNDLIEEADATYTYTLVDGDGYTVDSSNNSATFTVTDGVIGGFGPTVGVSAMPTTLYESEQTAVTLTFTAAGDIPPEGVVVVLEGPPRA
ncbi:MAG: calcium-binding protein, partial [Cyanobacteria bacterium P01_C01_bin.38]